MKTRSQQAKENTQLETTYKNETKRENNNVQTCTISLLYFEYGFNLCEHPIESNGWLFNTKTQ